MRTRLEQGLTALHLSPTPSASLERYCHLLLEQNQVMNLTAITDPDQVVDLHMLDSAALLTVADFRGKKVIDVGTGAGFPGLVLKVMEPSLDLTLLDSLGQTGELAADILHSWVLPQWSASTAGLRNRHCWTGIGTAMTWRCPVLWQTYGFWRNSACPL